MPDRLILIAMMIFAGSEVALAASPVVPDRVGPSANGGAVLPIQQIIRPAGLQVSLPGLRPQVLALSPDGKLLATSGKTAELVVIDPEGGKILQRVSLPAENSVDSSSGSISSHILQPDHSGQASYTGLIFSPDGQRIYLSNVNGSVKVFGIDERRQVSPLYSLPLPDTGLTSRRQELPTGLAISADGARLYVALALSNRLAELDVHTGRPLRFFDTGFMPYGVVLVGNRAYVTNWGGHRPDAQSVTGPVGARARVRVDPVRFIANEGSVTVVDLDSGKIAAEIPVGLHSSGIAASPDGANVFVANAGSDTVSVISTNTLQVTETISVGTGSSHLLGAGPNALAASNDGRQLFVCNGAQNSVAVINFLPDHSTVVGLIPVGWFPGAIAQGAGRLYVANIKGTGSGSMTVGGRGFNSHQFAGSLTLVPVPSTEQLREYTRQVVENSRREEGARALLPPRVGQPARPVPQRAGEPSVFKHVVYIIKENRTYDGVLGDMKEGNGDPHLCLFGEAVTPNEHKLAREFVLLDNTHCCGVLSADGHQWADTAYSTDYLERSFCGWPRSYPDGMEPNDVDAMAYSPGGFLWDNALLHGKTLRDYGEFTMGLAGWKDSTRKGSPSFLDYYRDFKDKTGLTNIRCEPAIQSLTPYIKTDTIGWNLRVPDVFRAAQFNAELKAFDTAGKMPDLTIICLPNDHTSGTSPGAPTPAAQVADNDLALGQIVEGISHSRFWKDTCIFVIEDDPQDGLDHVDSYRTTAFVVSPYTKRHAVVSANYSQVTMLHTMENILGLPPMTSLDAAAPLMTDCFTSRPDFSTYTAVPNNIPLDQMNPSLRAIREPVQRRYALLSSRLPLNQPDQCPDDLFNEILWHARKGYHTPYPALRH